MIPPKLAVIFTVHSGALIGAVEEDDSRRPLTDEETRALLADYERLKCNERALKMVQGSGPVFTDELGVHNIPPNE